MSKIIPTQVNAENPVPGVANITLTQKNTFRPWACLPDTIVYLRRLRGLKSNRVSKNVAAGINYSLIVTSCCLVEGIFESAFIHLWEDKRPKRKGFDEGAEEKALRRGAGLAGYDKRFQQTVGLRFSQMSHVAPIYEAMNALFHIRHLLAHGRASVYTFQPDFKEIGSKKNISYLTDYEKLESYLIKKKLMKDRISAERTEIPYLESAVADHFTAVAVQSIIAVIKSLDAASAEKFQKATGPVSNLHELLAQLNGERSSPMQRYSGRVAQVEASHFRFH